MTQDFNDKAAVYNLLRLVREQNDVIHQLRLMVGALMWLATKGDQEKLREFNAMMWSIDHGKPLDTEHEEQWRAWLLSTQREVELGHAELPS